MNLLLILILLVALIALLKFLHFKHRIVVIAAVLIFLFIYVSFSFATKGEEVDLQTSSGTLQAIKVYSVWLGNAFTNAKTISANVVNMEWVPDGHNTTELDPRNYMRG